MDMYRLRSVSQSEFSKNHFMKCVWFVTFVVIFIPFNIKNTVKCSPKLIKLLSKNKSRPFSWGCNKVDGFDDSFLLLQQRNQKRSQMQLTWTSAAYIPHNKTSVWPCEEPAGDCRTLASRTPILMVWLRNKRCWPGPLSSTGLRGISMWSGKNFILSGFLKCWICYTEWINTLNELKNNIRKKENIFSWDSHKYSQNNKIKKKTAGSIKTEANMRLICTRQKGQGHLWKNTEPVKNRVTNNNFYVCYLSWSLFLDGKNLFLSDQASKNWLYSEF